MESWKICWRKGFAPQLSTASLQKLLVALETDDDQLVQGVTVLPSHFDRDRLLPIAAACPIAYCGWQDGLETAAEAEEFFGLSCEAADKVLGGPAECRWFTNWVDDTPREEMRAQLAWEVRHELELRQEDIYVRIAE
jgi:hypothetical protein